MGSPVKKIESDPSHFTDIERVASQTRVRWGEGEDFTEDVYVGDDDQEWVESSSHMPARPETPPVSSLSIPGSSFGSAARGHRPPSPLDHTRQFSPMQARGLRITSPPVRGRAAHHHGQGPSMGSMTVTLPREAVTMINSMSNLGLSEAQSGNLTAMLSHKLTDPSWSTHSVICYSAGYKEGYFVAKTQNSINYEKVLETHLERLETYLALNESALSTAVDTSKSLQAQVSQINKDLSDRLAAFEMAIHQAARPAAPVQHVPVDPEPVAVNNDVGSVEFLYRNMTVLVEKNSNGSFLVTGRGAVNIGSSLKRRLMSNPSLFPKLDRKEFPDVDALRLFLESQS